MRGNSNKRKRVISAIAANSIALAMIGVTPSYAIVSATSTPSQPVVLNAPVVAGTSSISGMAWVDSNKNGIKENHEQEISNIEVTLTGTDADGDVVNLTQYTDDNGVYSFDELKAGSYVTSFGTTQDYQYFAKKVEGLRNMHSMTVGSVVDENGEFGVTIAEDANAKVNAGYIDTPSEGAAIQGVVWEDSNGNGIRERIEPLYESVSVFAIDPLVGSQYNFHTNEFGQYYFNVPPGDYILRFLTPANHDPYEHTILNEGNNEAIDSDVDPSSKQAQVTVADGQIARNIDAGIVSSSDQGGAIWGTVWEDEFDYIFDGNINNNEPRLDGVEVKIEGISTNTGGLIVRETTTNNLGEYTFLDVPKGRYNVIFQSPEPYGAYASAEGMYIAPENSVLFYGDNIGVAAVSVVGGTDSPEVNAGMLVENEMYIGLTAWDDVNENGIRENNEELLEGVDFALTGNDIKGNPVSMEMETDSDGQVNFLARTGDYTITATPPEGYQNFTIKNVPGDDEIDSDFNADGTTRVIHKYGQHNMSIGAGILAKPPTSTIGSFVWEDKDGDGIQDDDEPGISGVPVSLTGTNENGETVSLTDTTDEDGAYAFAELETGNYTVNVTLPQGYLRFSPAMAGVDVTKNSDVNSEGAYTLAVTAGTDRLNMDAGIIPESPAESSIGNTVWLDLNRNGIQDANESGIGNVGIALSGTNVDGETVTQSKTTDSNGAYGFGSLKKGIYTLNFTAPQSLSTDGFTLQNAGSDDELDSDVNSLGVIQVELAESSTNNTIDVGLLPAKTPSTVTAKVWFDSDANGIMEDGELGESGVTANLTGTDGDGNDINMTVTSNSEGEATFNNVPNGEYTIKFTLPGAYDGFSPKDVGSDDLKDSDFDEDGTFSFTLGKSAVQLEIAAGLVKGAQVDPTPEPTPTEPTPSETPTETPTQVVVPTPTETVVAPTPTKTTIAPTPAKATVTKVEQKIEKTAYYSPESTKTAVTVVEDDDRSKTTIKSGGVEAKSSVSMAALGLSLILTAMLGMAARRRYNS